MKATGIIRRTDDLGRVVIPKEIRRTMGIREGDPLEFFVNEDGSLTLVPYFTNASARIRAIADNIGSTSPNPEDWEIANELNKLAKKLEKNENKG